MAKPKTAAEDRFKELYEIDPVTGCWIWQKSTNNVGYGMFRWERGKMMTAHKASYILHNSPVPKTMCVSHGCDNYLCVNPNHLKLLNRQQLRQDKMSRGTKYGRIPGFKQPIKTCEHCGYTGPVTAIGRNHNDKCKSKI